MEKNFEQTKADEIKSKINSCVDFTLLDARATKSDLEKLCDVAYKNEYYAVCVNPCNVSFVKGYILKNLNGALKVASVVGFPLGANSTMIKCQEARECLADGADEIDVVINIGKAKEGKFDYIKNELKKIKKIAKNQVVKVIIETCYFDKNEIIKLAKICMAAKVDFVKTSTGFGTAGATAENVKLIYDTVKGVCKIKAAGGIRGREQAMLMINAGADRLGCSHII